MSRILFQPGHLDAYQVDIEIRVAGERLAVMDGADGAAGGEVDADAEGALVEIGAAVGLAGGGAQHGHDRIAVEHDDADVRRALIADVGHHGGGADAVFDDGAIALAAEAEEAGEDVGDVVAEFVAAEGGAAGFQVFGHSCGRR
jgi:hypothetical protein